MIGAIVLAAGCGQRFGYAPKLLAPFEGAPLITRMLAAIQDTRLAPIVLVTGRRPAAIAALGRRWIRPASRLRIVRNTRYRRGVAGSLQCGLRALPPRCDAVMICLADMPGISAADIRRLCAAWRTGLDYVRPVHDGHPGHPVIVSRRVFAAIDGLTGDAGAQHILSAVAPERCRLIADRRTSVVDVDTPQALRRAWRQRRGRVALLDHVTPHCRTGAYATRTHDHHQSRGSIPIESPSRHRS